MLSLLITMGLLSQPALAGGGSVTPDETINLYDACKIGVLMDWTQDKALAFRVVHGKINMESATPLTFEVVQNDELNFEWAETPFPEITLKAIIPIHELRAVVGVIAPSATSNPVFLSGYSMGPDAVTIQGLTGQIDLIEDPYGCGV